MKDKAQEFDDLIKSRMVEFLKTMGFADFSVADNRSRGLAFLKFYLYEIFSVFNEIDEDSIESSIVDKQNDLGVDFIYNDENQIFIIQSKYIGSKSRVSYADIDKLIHIPISLKNKEFIKDANDELKEILYTILPLKNPTFNLIFLTSDNIPQDKIDCYNSLIKQPNVTLQILDRSHLKQEYKRIESISSLPPNEVVLELGSEDFFYLEELEHSAHYPTSIFTLKGTKIQQLYQKHGEKLFNYNIRLWLGEKNAVNKSMIDTIVNEPDRFIYYNNGITVVCENFMFEPETRRLVCRNFQIINGAQTVTTIAKQSSINLSKVKVLTRIIAGERGNDTHSITGLNETIVKNTNSQSVINPSDFRSNDQIQISIEHNARKLCYTVSSPFKPIFYQRKRRKEKPKGNKVITMQDLGKGYYSYAYDPYELNASIRKLWDISGTGVYYKVFGVDGEGTDSIDNEKLCDMFGVFFIYEYIKNKVKDFDKKIHPSAFFKYHILWGTRILLELKYSKDDIHKILKDIVIEGKYVNPKVNTKMEEKFSLLVERVIKNIDNCIKRIQRDSGTFVIRNYQRKKEFAEGIKLQIQELIVPESDIPDLLL